MLEVTAIGLATGGPLALKVLVDGMGQGHASTAWALGLVVAFILSWFGGGVLQAWRQGFSQNMLNRLNAVIVDEALTSVMPQLVGNRDGDSGRLLGVMERLPYSLQVIVEGLIWQIAPTLVQVLISLAIILSILKPLYVVILALTLLGFAISAWFGAVRQNTVSLEAGAAAGHVSETLGDVLRNARRVVLNGALSAERQLMAERFEAKRQAFRRMLTSQVLMALLQYGTAGLGLACLLTLGAYDVLAGRMTIGEFVLLQAYGFRLVLPLSGFGFVISQAAIALLTVREVLDLGRDEQAARIISTPPDGAAELVLRNVAFSYGPGLSGLHDVNVTLAPGSFNVIVGPNGSGKSTLAQVMAGLLEPTSGDVVISGVPLRTVPWDQRYRFMLYVPQTVTLLNRSLLANALYPPSGQSEADIAQLLAEWRFFDPAREIDFSLGVGEQGERLSGGQIQKLELARIAGVKVPAIILDESTSALDPASEADVIRTLRKGIRANTTLIMITHRKSVAENADQVLFMKNGTLLRAGRHEVLMQDSAAYARLWETLR
ncbi:Lipid A export ATP-binding/permease protein MsbA (plasmid) [Asticcacaulis sp. MM231]|uniref:ABC transporter ATP-binding protein n=1 Tax=Asticcacaulis sp. MM231 TaxID=3157666 RepID=UPI0032D5935B